MSGSSKIRSVVEETDYENDHETGNYEPHQQIEEFENQHDVPGNSYNSLYDHRDSSASNPRGFSAIHRRIPSLASIHRRVTTRKSPVMHCFYKHIPISLCLDTGAESNLVSEMLAKTMNLEYTKTDQGALQADEKSPLSVVGEVSKVKITKGAYVFILDALVIKADINYIVAGEPFLEENDIAIRPAKRIIIIQGRETIPYAQSV